jgi:glycosyltransferase involved in cell wall biosynthesis
VTVSSRRLATVVRGLVDVPVVVVPNAIDTAWWRAVWRHRERLIPGLVVGWAGGKRPDGDFRPLAEAWGRLARRHPDVTFAMAGHCPKIMSEAIPPGRLKGLPWLPIDMYPLDFMQFDISCCVVDNTAFNRCKTPIKVWESTMARATVVASPTLYGQAIDDGVDGLLAETADEWERQIERLIVDPDLRKRLWRNQRRRVAAEHSLDKNLWRWPAAYATIIADYRARRARSRILLPGTMERHAFGVKVLA